jgi:hypothetical protein
MPTFINQGATTILFPVLESLLFLSPGAGVWVLPGLDNCSCLSGPVRPLRLVVCVTSSLPSARLAPEGSRMLSYLFICIACYRTCMHSRCVRYVYPPSGAGPCRSIYLVSCPSRSSRCLCVVMFWSYLIITGNAPLGHSHLCHPFIYGSPAFPLLSRIIRP